jgi:hypothetical protein
MRLFSDFVRYLFKNSIRTVFKLYEILVKHSLELEQLRGNQVGRIIRVVHDHKNWRKEQKLRSII